MTSALKEYHQDVKTRQFPAPQNTYPIDPAQLENFYAAERERLGQEEEEQNNDRTVHASML